MLKIGCCCCSFAKSCSTVCDPRDMGFSKVLLFPRMLVLSLGPGGFPMDLCDFCFLPACQASLSPTISGSFPKFMSVESVMLSDYLILFHPSLLLPSIFPSIRVLPKKSPVHIRRHLNFSISLSNE